MRAKLLIIMVMVLVVAIALPTLAQENSIIIPSQVEVRSLDVQLSEIAKIKGNPQFINQVETITLGQTPYPGYQRVIYRDDVIYALQQKNINISELKLRIPYQFTVKANYNQLAVEKLVNYGKSYIIEQLTYQRDKLQIKVLNPPEQLLVPAGKIDFEIEANASRRLLGVNMLPIKVLVDGESYRKFYVKFKTGVWQETLIAKERLARNQSLSEDLFAKQKKLITNGRSKYVSSPAELKNKILKRPVAANEPLTYDLLETPALVKRWQEVELIAKIGGITVATTGKALETGREGDIIKVKNTNSNKKIEAKVVAPNQVEAVIN